MLWLQLLSYVSASCVHVCKPCCAFESEAFRRSIVSMSVCVCSGLEKGTVGTHTARNNLRPHYTIALATTSSTIDKQHIVVVNPSHMQYIAQTTQHSSTFTNMRTEINSQCSPMRMEHTDERKRARTHNRGECVPTVIRTTYALVIVSQKRS